MERSLCLILNGGKSNIMPLNEIIALNLETMDSNKLDEYVSKKFNSSDEIRNKYSSRIIPFLEDNKMFLSKVESESGKKYNGSIVIIESLDNSIVERKKVLYKKDIILFKEIIKNKKFMLELEKRNYINYQSTIRSGKKYNLIFSEFIGTQLRFYSTSDSKFTKIINQWINSIKEYSYYYDIIRRVLNEYQNRYKELGLDSMDVIYSKYLDRKKKDVLEQFETLNSKYEEPVRYPKIYDEEGYPGDLEDYSPERHLKNNSEENFEFFEDDSVEKQKSLYKIKRKKD